MEPSNDREHLLEAHTAKKALHYMELLQNEKDRKAIAADREAKKRKYEDEREQKGKRARCKFCSQIGHFTWQCNNPRSLEERKAAVERYNLCPACLGPASDNHQLYSCRQVPFNLELTCRQPEHLAAHIIHNKLLCEILYPANVPGMDQLALDGDYEEEIQI